MTDRPYSGLTIDILRPDGETRRTRSNLAGFANFKMSFNNDRFAVSRPGKHIIQARPRAGWKVTSFNDLQSLDFRELQGSPAGIIVKQTCDPIGVAPLLTVSGSIALDQFDDVQFLTAESPEGEAVDLDIAPEGVFNTPVSRGQWTFTLDTDQQRLSRKVDVTTVPVVLSQFLPVQGQRRLQHGSPLTLSFDDLTGSDTLYEIPNGYGGLNWTNWIATHHKFYEGYGYINATVSSEYMAYNSSGHPAVVESKEPFDFIGVYLTAAWPQAEQSDTLIRAWRGNELVYQDRLRLSTAGPIYFAADYRDINKIVFSTEKYWQLIVDDFQYRHSHEQFQSR